MTKDESPLKLSWPEITLTESENFLITYVFETVYLRFKTEDRKRTEVGELYGDPVGAAISADERWVVSVGCGYVCTRLSEPYLWYQSEQFGSNCFFDSACWNDEPEDTWYKSVEANEDGSFTLLRADGTEEILNPNLECMQYEGKLPSWLGKY